MSKLDTVKKIAGNIVSYALKQGAETAEAHVNISTDFETEVRNGEIENLSEADSHSIYITVSKNSKRASVSSCDFGEGPLQNLVDHAMFLCRYTDQDPFYSLPAKDLLATHLPDLDLFDGSISETDPRVWLEKITELEKIAVAKDPRLNSDGSFIGTNKSQFALANSLGFCEGLETTSINVGISLFAEDTQGLNSGRKQSSGYSTFSCFAEDLESLEEVAHQASRRVLRKLGSRKPKTGVFPIYFEPGMARKLMGTLLTGIKGSRVFRKETYLANQLGKTIASPYLEITEDPFIKRGLNSRAFDSEGVRTVKRSIIKDGRLETFLLNSYSANKLGLQTTGHAGGYGNMFVTPGHVTEHEMLKKMGTGLWLTEMSGQGIKLITGDYSRGASGLWVENGEAAYPVSEFTISSNLETMLKDILLIGNNPEARRTIITPGMVIAEMTLSGTN